MFMKKCTLKGLLLLFPLLFMVSCQPSPADDELNGRITLWHSWSPAEAVVLEDALSEFEEIHPHVRIITVALPEEQLLPEFYKVGNDGLAPALLIGEDSWVGELVEAGLIRPLAPEETPNGVSYLRNSALVQYDGKRFGVPVSLAPRALYYNLDRVDTPPETLDELLAEAAKGNQVAFVPRFEKGYWGIQAFGKGLFDEQDQFTLAESGFTEWLRWLDNAQQAPGVILNVDDDSLFELFTTGGVAYYVAGPEKQAQIPAMIDEENPLNFGVVPLPEGPQGDSGPLLPAETILLYAFTSPDQSRIANALAAFLVNQQQSIRFMRELDHIPANPAVTVDQRIYPIVNGFARQARTAVVIPNEIPTDSFAAAGDSAYANVLSGALTPEEATCRFGQEVISLAGVISTEQSLPEGCDPKTP
jgi:arabinogalactan oligomer/maltooligosaccharide transport system substrate-binding protein